MLTIRQLKNSYTAEQIMLVLLARLYFKTATETEIGTHIADNQINWALLYKIIRAHGLRPLAYFVIRQHNIDVPEQFKTRLQKDYDESRRKNLAMVITASRLVAGFKQQGITLIPYKGPIFSHSFFGDVAMRESADLDFLVAPEDVDEIENYFIGNNYPAKVTVPKAYLPYYKRHFKDIVYCTAAPNAFSVEIHWRLMQKFSGDYPGYAFFVPHLQPCPIGGLQLHRLSHTYDLLAIISNHFVKDMSIKFKYMVDVAGVISKDPQAIDLDELLNTANKYGFKKRLLTGLALTEALLGLKLKDSLTHKTDVAEFLPAALAFPLHLPRLYINEPEFIKRSLKLQDNTWRKAKFLFYIARYTFLPTYEDINGQKTSPKHPLLLMISRPFRLLRAAQPKKITVAVHHTSS